MSNLVHNEQVKLSATFLNNLAVTILIGVFLAPAFYTQHTILQQALSIGVGLAAALGCGWSHTRGCGGCGNDVALEHARSLVLAHVGNARRHACEA